MSDVKILEPLCYRKEEYEEGKLIDVEYNGIDVFSGGRNNGIPLVSIDQAESYAAAKVREALEEAAKVCDYRANQNELATSAVEPDELSSLRSAAWQMSVCARAIRALIK